MPYYGKLFTYDDLHKFHIKYGIKEKMDRRLETVGSFVGSYIEVTFGHVA